jgi:hypothetical protein
MKKVVFLSVVFILAMSINIGCDKLDIVEELTLDIEFVANSSTADFTSDALLDADSLSDVIAEYSNKIKDIEVLEATYQIISVGGTNQATKINSSTLTVADETGAGEEIITNVSNQDIVYMSAPQPLTLDPAGVARFEELMTNSPHRALLKNTGTAEGAPVDFRVKFVFKVKMTANPL